MNWYYVDQGQQAGPVDDAEFNRLCAAGQIQEDTLVWHEGMTDWVPCAEAVRGAAAKPAASAPVATVLAMVPEAVCAECGRMFPIENMIRHGNAYVCAACKPVFVQKLAEGAAIPVRAMYYAGFWIRLVAKFVDGLIIGVVFLLPLFIISFRRAMEGGPEPEFGMQLLFQLGYYLGNMAYSIFFVGRYGATPGKMVCKLQIVTAEGEKVTYLRATGRFFAELLSGLICNIGYIIAAFDDEKRALHDHICSTRVIHKPQ